MTATFAHEVTLTAFWHQIEHLLRHQRVVDQCVAHPSSRWALRVSNSGSPGPAPARYTVPATLPSGATRSAEESVTGGEKEGNQTRTQLWIVQQRWQSTSLPQRLRHAVWSEGQGRGQAEGCCLACTSRVSATPNRIPAVLPTASDSGWTNQAAGCAPPPRSVHQPCLPQSIPNKSHHWGQAPERAPWACPLRRIRSRICGRSDRAWLPGNNSNGINSSDSPIESERLCREHFDWTLALNGNS